MRKNSNIIAVSYPYDVDTMNFLVVFCKAQHPSNNKKRNEMGQGLERKEIISYCENITAVHLKISSEIDGQS